MLIHLLRVINLSSVNGSQSLPGFAFFINKYLLAFIQIGAHSFLGLTTSTSIRAFIATFLDSSWLHVCWGMTPCFFDTPNANS